VHQSQAITSYTTTGAESNDAKNDIAAPLAKQELGDGAYAVTDLMSNPGDAKSSTEPQHLGEQPKLSGE
jgi:hypothetical protein